MTSLSPSLNFNMKAIMACDASYGIGIHNQLPNWKLKNDLKLFKEMTIGNGNNVVIMGKNTWVSIGEKPLLNRMNFVLSSQYVPEKDQKDTQVCFFQRYEDIINELRQTYYDTIWIIGGSQIYDLFIEKCNTIYLSQTVKKFECTTFLSQKCISALTSKNKTISIVQYLREGDGYDAYKRYICS